MPKMPKIPKTPASKEVIYFDDPDSPFDSTALRLFYGNPRYSGWYYKFKSGGLFGPYRTELKAKKALEKYKEEK